VDELRVILQASKTNLLSFGFFIGFFIFILETEERDQTYCGMAIDVHTKAKEKQRKALTAFIGKSSSEDKLS